MANFRFDILSNDVPAPRSYDELLTIFESVRSVYRPTTIVEHHDGLVGAVIYSASPELSEFEAYFLPASDWWPLEWQLLIASVGQLSVVESVRLIYAAPEATAPEATQ